MSISAHTRLPDRGVIAVTGADRATFLQGIVSNDVTKVSETQAGYGAFLTPQGKYLFDFFMVMSGDTLLIDCEAARIGDFIKRLTMYKLRADVQLADVSDSIGVFAVFGDNVPEILGLDGARGLARPLVGGAAFVDPRLAEAGARLIGPVDSVVAAAGLDAADCQETKPEDYDRHRLSLGLPDGSRDLAVDKATLMESGFDELNGIDWTKGCYMGQEVTARMKHRGLVKKRLMPVVIEGSAPEPGSNIVADGRTVGEMRSAFDGRGLALLKLDVLDAETPLEAGDSRLTPERPAWANF